MQRPKPQHDSVCDALGCGVRCPIAAMQDGLRAAESLLTDFANDPAIYKAAPASIMHALRKVQIGLSAAVLGQTR